MGIGDDQLHLLEAAPDQALQESRPEGLGLGGAKPETDDLAPAIAVDGDGDYRRHRDDTTPSRTFR